MLLQVQRTPGPGYSEPLSCLGEVEVEVACQVREVVAVVRHPSLVKVAEGVGEECLDRRAVAVEVEVVVVFQAREVVVEVHQTLQVAVEEEVVGVEVGTA